jgi:hypothetical protein
MSNYFLLFKVNDNHATAVKIARALALKLFYVECKMSSESSLCIKKSLF